MKPLSIVAAIVAGIIGAIAWALIAKYMHVELGFLAWGIGLLVGFLSMLVGGRGSINGVMCAVVALVSMFGGKMLGARLDLPDYVREMIAQDQRTAEWTAQEREEAVDAFVKQISITDLAEGVIEELDVIDLIFAVIGVASAFKLGAGGTEDEDNRPRVPMGVGMPGGPSPDSSSADTERVAAVEPDIPEERQARDGSESPWLAASR